MTFLFAAGLAVALFVVAPFVAHLLQRRKADERDFPPAHLVPASPPVARRRRKVDDRLLYAVRTASIVALALLGASPFVHCSALSIGRQGGASIAMAIVLDDSLSMSADSGQGSRWDRAKKAASELVSGAREGDAVGIVLVGSPPRIALASTTDLAAAQTVVEGLVPSHRATDLEGSVELARSLLHGLPQVDHRIILLSDLADGHPEAAPIGQSSEVPVWIPLSDLATPAGDCAVIRADRQRSRALVHVACAPAGESKGRSVEVVAGDRVVAHAALPDAAPNTDVGVDVGDTPGELFARLTGKDAIAADDAAPILATTGKLAVAIIADPAGSKLITGGAPPVEQALSALEFDLGVRPLPILPDHAEDLNAYAAIVIEDPAGFTPESRRALALWLERGGVALLALGSHAPLAPLGASFEPLVQGAVNWGPSPAKGLDDRAGSLFGAAATGLDDLKARGRATFDTASLAANAVLARWSDGAPWLIERAVGRGLAFVLTVPTSPDVSDLALRPAFLMLLEKLVDAARVRNGAHRATVGEAWTFEGAKSLDVTGPDKERLRVTDEPSSKVVTPDRIGVYDVVLDGDKFVRVAAAEAREVDLRPRAVAQESHSASLGDVRKKLDLSPLLAVILLALLVAELALRLLTQRSAQKAARETPETAVTAPSAVESRARL
ncbi:MAG TPA: VWA domain-containing protein [Polyangiaceae bacterium]|nr:VWA domain-containing protein [Polyangiaceae bacterium]